MGCTKLKYENSSHALKNNDLQFLLGIDNTPYRFNGKEIDPETGNQYYGARYYDPKISVWLSVDPLAHEFSNLTPYNFVEGNPVMLIDPNGLSASPVYDLDGIHIGNTSEGFAGEILIYSGSEDVDFSKLNHHDAANLDDVSTLNDKVAADGLSDEAFSKVMTSVAENADGNTILSKVRFDFDDVGGEIKTGQDPSSTFYYEDDEIFAVQTTDMDYTVENVQTAILAHEYYGHHVTQKSDAKHNHRYAYMFELQYIFRNNINATPRYIAQTTGLLIRQIALDHPNTNVQNEFNRLRRTWQGRP